MTQQDNYTTVEGSEGPVNVRLVNEGEKYGPKRAFTCGSDGSIIEFYDGRTANLPGRDALGTYVQRFYVSALMTMRSSYESEGLTINGSEVSMGLDAGAIGEILSWLDVQEWKPFGMVTD